jgi:feruloyl esterase
VNFYKSVSTELGESAVSSSMRLFMVPGMGHCGGGEGPNTFDMMVPLEQWVEKGQAPTRVDASHSTNGKIDRTRPLCRYPQVAQYAGTGSIDAADNFVCRQP